MALEGTIRDFGLPDIFQLIGLQRKTGHLTLTNEKDDESVTVTFENGMVVMGDSSARRLEDRLGNVLVKQGKVTRERLDEALGVQKQTLQRLGHILASSSAITTKDLRDALKWLDQLEAPGTVELMAGGDADVIGYARDGDDAVCVLLRVRDGKLIARDHRILDNLEEEDDVTILEHFLIR